jgi:sterol 3beta-glucosyltransferase
VYAGFGSAAKGDSNEDLRINHSGAGTTVAGLRAGVPAVDTPVGGDQYPWRERIVVFGARPKAPGYNKLTAENLASTIHKVVNDSEMGSRAPAVGAQTRGESSLTRAMKVNENHPIRINENSRQGAYS